MTDFKKTILLTLMPALIGCYDPSAIDSDFWNSPGNDALIDGIPPGEYFKQFAYRKEAEGSYRYLMSGWEEMNRGELGDFHVRGMLFLKDDGTYSFKLEEGLGYAVHGGTVIHDQLPPSVRSGEWSLEERSLVLSGLGVLRDFKIEGKPGALLEFTHRLGIRNYLGRQLSLANGLYPTGIEELQKDIADSDGMRWFTGSWSGGIDDRSGRVTFYQQPRQLYVDSVSRNCAYRWASREFQLTSELRPKEIVYTLSAKLKEVAEIGEADAGCKLRIAAIKAKVAAGTAHETIRFWRLENNLGDILNFEIDGKKGVFHLEQ